MRSPRISIDTRTIQPGDAFIPVGNGHAFCDEALKKGATVLDVDLTEYAIEHRRQFSGEVIAVVGSFGKTTLKDYLSHSLGKLGASATKHNYNNEIGVPLTIANAQLSDTVWIIECGIRQPGDMAVLCNIVQPTMVVFSGFGYSHMEFYNTEHDLLAEKLSIICNHTKHLFLPNNIRYLNDIQSSLSSHDQLCIHTIPVDRLIDTPFALTMAISEFFNISAPSKESLIVTHSPHRMKKQALTKGITLIDDTYNSNPISVQFSIETILQHYPANQLIVVLGDMLELGTESNALHNDTLQWCLQHAIKAVITYGELFSTSKQNLVTHDTLIDHIESIVEPNDCILIKDIAPINWTWCATP